MKILLFTFIIILNTISFTQKINYYKSVKVDTTRIISEQQLVDIANQIFKSNYPLLSQEKFFVDQKLNALENIKDSLKFAKELSSISVVFTGTGESQLIPIVFSAKAALLFPRDTQIVNNFGAVLRMMDSEKSVKVFLYAKSLCNNSPLIITNLGNSLFEMFDDKSAEYFYKRSLQINPEYALARHGLINVYFKRKDLQSALREMFKGLTGIYSQSLGKAQDRLKYQAKNFSPPEPPKNGGNESDGNSNSPQNSDSNNPNEKLELPEFPAWSDEAALINDKSINNVKDDIAKQNSEASEYLFKEADALKSMSKQEIQKWYDNKFKSGRMLSEKNEFGLSMLEEYFEDELDKLNKDYIKKDKENNDKFSKSLIQIDSWAEGRIKALESQASSSPEAGMANVMKSADFLVERCNRTMNLIKDTFGDWKNIAAQRHNKYNELLNTYWIYCEQYLNQTYDKNEFEKLDNKRKMFVLSNYSIMMQDYSMRQIEFGVLNMTAFANINGECPQAPPKPELKPKSSKIKVPDKSPIPCPFEGSKLKLGLGACSFGLDCESVEAECGEGIIGAVKWNYKKKEMTLFAGLGGKANFGFGRGNSDASKNLNESMGAEFEAKGGYQITFNKDNQVIDHGATGEVSAKGNLGGFSAGATYGATITAATGISDEFTNEFSGTVFK